MGSAFVDVAHELVPLVLCIALAAGIGYLLGKLGRRIK